MATNGGNTSTGRLIGLNTAGIDNLMVYQFDNLSAGLSVTGATVNVGVAQAFANGNHGTTEDLINLHELALPNGGWSLGMGAIGGAPNGTDDGSISYLNREQFLPGGFVTSSPWLNAAGSPVANIDEAITTLGSVNAYDQGAAPAIISFSIDQATAQSWVDNGLAGLVLSTTDNGDSRSRFNFNGDGASIDLLTGATVTTDFDGDGLSNCTDLDSLVDEIVAASNSTAFDLTGDGFVQNDDLAQWLVDAGAADNDNPYVVGDTNLDRAVDSTDLGLLLNNFSSTAGVGYCNGDLDANGSVDSSDLGLLLNNFGSMPAANSVSVPEPSSFWGIVFLCFSLLISMRRKRI